MRRSYWLVPLVVFSCAAKKPKKGTEPPKPTVGWYQEAAWPGACYFPPEFGTLGVGDRRMARDNAREALMEQWQGKHGPLQLDETLIENLETVMLGSPEKVEIAAIESYDLCSKAMVSGDLSPWKAWAEALPGRLLKGVCRRPLDDTLFFYLDIGASWQFQASVCDDDRIEISATTMDYYRVDDKGPWINVEGDTSRQATGTEYLCNTEGCYPGTLLLRFRGESGAVVIKPIGAHAVFDPPEHGTIDIAINDTTYFNNVYKTESNITHHTGVTYEPVK
ncbi:MAG TPA: hypothetical protein PKA64_03455 [Myxococcota bacterium]|nr:hypothetical protein [Myxococcota bacterium]